MISTLIALLLTQTVIYVSPPSPTAKVYEGQGISFKYPENWELIENQRRVVVFPKQARMTSSAGNKEFYTHGMFVGFFQQTWRADLRSLSDDVFRAIAQGNPGTQKIQGSERAMQVNGRDALMVGFLNPQAPSPMGPEQSILITVQEGHGVWFWLMFAPAVEIKTYNQTFASIAESIRLGDEPTHETGEHSEHATFLGRVVDKLKNNKLRLPQFRVMLTSDEHINAYASHDYSLVVLPVAMVRFLQGNEGELAFVVAHELGHLADTECAAQLKAGAMLGQIRACEARADEIGLQYLAGAGYNPYDAAAFFGRMMMFTGETSLLRNFFKRFTSDHPIDSDRISGLRKALIRYCHQSPGACR